MRKPAADRNYLLASLPHEERARLEPFLRPHPLAVRDCLHEPGRPITHVYFPVNGVASLVTTMHDGESVEAATVGNEGMVGLPIFLETGRAPLEAFVQIPGDSLRMSASAFRSVFERGGALHAVVQRYTQVLFRLIAQSSGCNRAHNQLQRCARWLLMSHDRVRGDTIHLTHEFLAQMLGVRRATVTVAALELKRRGVIDYRLGAIRILDRSELERISCECYGVVRADFDRLEQSSAEGEGF